MTATYQIKVEPGPTGQRIWVDLTLVNSSDVDLFGESGGELLVTHPVRTPSQPPNIEWGGSSADTAGADARTSSTKRIYTIAGRKLDAHADSRVSLFGVYTELTRDGDQAGCKFPARVRAPAGLVLGHPRGRWFLTVERGERIRNRGFLRML